MKELTIMSLLKNQKGFPKIIDTEIKISNTPDTEPTINATIIMSNVGKPICQYGTKGQRLHILRQIIQRLHVLHKNGIVHCDLKPDNVLVDNLGNVSIIDFTHSLLEHPISKILCPNQMVFTTCVYQAPEIYENTQKNRSVDIWALGCIYYEMITGKYLLYGDSSVPDLGGVGTIGLSDDCSARKCDIHENIKYDISTREYVERIRRLNIDDFEKQLLYSMTAITPSARPTTKQLLENMNINIPDTNMNTTINKKNILSYIDNVKPKIFGLDNALSQLGYNMCEYVSTKLTHINKNNLHIVIFAIIHLLYYPTMDLHTDIYTQGFIRLTDKLHSDVLIESHELIKLFIQLYPFVSNYFIEHVI
jgi:serine/threonine protein kinase